MIGEGLFRAQLSTVERILKRVGLFEERQPFPTKGLGAAFFRRKTYRETYEVCVGEFAYDFKLTDQSLLLFEKSGNNEHDGVLTYTFYECPIELMPYVDFVANELGLSQADDEFESAIAEWGDELRSEYELYAASSDTKHLVTPIRYDYVAAHYRQGIHPASHVHFGFDNEVRVGTRRVMNPISFVLFIIRQRYPSNWGRLNASVNAENWCRNVRDYAELVHVNYWLALDDRREVYLQ